MVLIIPVLRLAMLFLNIYETYKTMKMPPPSRRNDGQPSQRALSQRKRDLKGCLAVWIVWSCYITYERLAEVIVSLFVPFYDEFKALALLYLIFTRAKGAEPLFLHVLRPLLKPYTPVVDPLLGFLRTIGDMLFAIVNTPLSYAYTWWRSSMFYNDEVLETPGAVTPQPAIRASVMSQHDLSMAFSRQAMKAGQHTPPNFVKTSVRSRQIWHPPSSFSGRESNASQQCMNGTNSLSAMQAQAPVSEEVKQQLEEWRQYPAFPSAYPPTPLGTTILPLPVAPPTLPVISEEAFQEHQEWRQYPAFPSAYPPSPMFIPATRLPAAVSSPILPGIPEDLPSEDFGQSLTSQPKPSNLGLSDDLPPEVQSARSEDMIVDSNDEQGDDGDDDNDDDDDDSDGGYGDKLKTPYSRDVLLDDDDDDDADDNYGDSLKTPYSRKANNVPLDGDDADEDAHRDTLKTPYSRPPTIIPLEREPSKTTSIRSGSTLRTRSSSETLSDEPVTSRKKRAFPTGTARSKRTSGAIRRANVTSSARVVIHAHDEDIDSKTSSTDVASDVKPAISKKRRVVLSPTRAGARPRVVRYAAVKTQSRIRTRPPPQKDVNVTDTSVSGSGSWGSLGSTSTNASTCFAPVMKIISSNETHA